MLDLAVAVEQHDGGARRRVGGERADEPLARLRIPQCVPRGRGARDRGRRGRARRTRRSVRPSPATTHLTTLGANADRDAVLDAGRVEQVAVQLAVGQAAGLDGLGEAQRRTPSGGMRGQQRMTRRVAHDRRERTGRLGLGRDRLVSHGAGRELDAIPHQHVCGHELREPRQRPAAQLGHRTGLGERPGEPVRRAHVGVGEPGHGLTRHDTPRDLPSLPALAPRTGPGVAGRSGQKRADSARAPGGSSRGRSPARGRAARGSLALPALLLIARVIQRSARRWPTRRPGRTPRCCSLSVGL